MGKRLSAAASERKFQCTALAFLLAIGCLFPAEAGLGAGKSQLAGGLSEAELSGTERKLLQRTFEHDPVGKRLQRLELLVFGATQFGSESERCQHLQSSLLQRKKEQTGRRSGQQQNDGATANSEVELLEREILKKNFTGEPIGKRLARLETKLFGQPSLSMANPQRVERLKRTTGLVDLSNGPQTAIIPERSGRGFRSIQPFSSPFNGQGVPGFPDFGQSDPQMRELLRQMDQQMRGFDQFGEGQALPDMPKNGQYNFRFFYQGPDGKPHYYQSPNGKSEPAPGFKSPKKPTIPGLRVPNTNEVPPYGDPNSI